jgi:hypothetical protein
MQVDRMIVRIGVFALALLLSSAALAQPAPRVREPIDVERFKPYVTHDGFVMVEGSAVRPEADRWEFGGYIQYGLNQLIVINENDDIADKFVSGRLGFDLLGSVTICRSSSPRPATKRT